MQNISDSSSKKNSFYHEISKCLSNVPPNSSHFNDGTKVKTAHPPFQNTFEQNQKYFAIHINGTLPYCIERYMGSLVQVLEHH